MTNPPHRLIAYFCLALSMALVGGYVAMTKPLSAALPVFLLIWLRFGIAAVAMGSWLKKPADEAPMTKDSRRLIFLESFFGNFLFTILMVSGVSLTGGVTAAVVMASLPAVVALLSWMLLGEKITPRNWCAVALAVAGVMLFALSNQELPAQAGQAPEAENSTNHVFWGYVLLVGAVICEAFYSVIGKKLTGLFNPKRISAMINLWGLVLATPMGLYLAWSFDFGAVALQHWVMLFVYAITASAITVWLWMTGLHSVPAAQAGVFTVFLPISAAAVGVGVLGESINTMQLTALGVALSSVLVATWPTRAQVMQTH